MIAASGFQHFQVPCFVDGRDPLPTAKSLPRPHRFNAPAQNFKIPLWRDKAGQRNRHGVLPTALTALMIFGKFPIRDRSVRRIARYDKLRLPRSRTRSSASICAISSRRTSIPSLCRRANRASAAAVSAMNAAASSGPPSPGGSSVGDPAPFSGDAGVRRATFLVKKYPMPCNIDRYSFRERNSRAVFHNFLDGSTLPPSMSSTSGDLTPGPTAPMFALKRPTRVSRNRPLFFP